MDQGSNFNLPNDDSIFKEIAKGEQTIQVTTVQRRYGKVITIVSGFDKSIDLKTTAKSLKEALACGGTVKDNHIELQGDHKKNIKPALLKAGFSEESIVFV